MGILEAWPSVVSVHDVKTQQPAPETYRLKAEVRFKASHLAQRLDDDTVPAGSTTAFVARMIRMLSDDIDSMERAVEEAIPNGDTSTSRSIRARSRNRGSTTTTTRSSRESWRQVRKS